MPKSPDAFRTISEVADWLDVQAHVLRFWESKFSQVKPIKRAGGRRYYRPADMKLLGGIKKLLHDEGLTIKGVQQTLREDGISAVAALSQPLDGDDVVEMLTKDADQPAAPPVDQAAAPADQAAQPDTPPLSVVPDEEPPTDAIEDAAFTPEEHPTPEDNALETPQADLADQKPNILVEEPRPAPIDAPTPLSALDEETQTQAVDETPQPASFATEAKPSEDVAPLEPQAQAPEADIPEPDTAEPDALPAEAAEFDPAPAAPNDLDTPAAFTDEAALPDSLSDPEPKTTEPAPAQQPQAATEPTLPPLAQPQEEPAVSASPEAAPETPPQAEQPAPLGGSEAFQPDPTPSAPIAEAASEQRGPVPDSEAQTPSIPVSEPEMPETVAPENTAPTAPPTATNTAEDGTEDAHLARFEPETATDDAPSEPASDVPPPAEPATPKPRQIEIPPLLAEDAYPATPAVLSAAARLRSMSPEQADRLRPLLQDLARLRDAMASAHKAPPSGPPST